MLPVEVFRPTLTKLVGVLRHVGIRFHLTGGITAVAYGEPRMTQDRDLVIDAAATMRNRDALLAALIEAGFYLEGALPGELDRSVMADVLPGLALPIAARSDAALSMLIWAGRGNHKSRRDLRRILERATVEEATIVRRGAAERDLLGLLEEILGEPELE